MTKLEKLKFRVEDRTGILFGTYRWDADYAGPAPLFGFVIRPNNGGYIPFEVVIRGRSFYVTRMR